MTWDARARANLGMGMFLIASGVLFGLLLIALISFRDAGLAAQNLNLRMGALLTALLVLSAFALWRARSSKPTADPRPWLLTGAVSGTAFLIAQAYDFRRLISRNLTVAQSPFGSAYFTLAGVHALSVLAGVIILALLLTWGRRIEFGDRRAAALSAVVLYWYFTGAVWLLIFGVAYLWSLL